jgi:hypothetical protein
MCQLAEETVMQPLDARKAIRDLSRLCKEHGLELTRLPAKGKGSHQGLLFRDPKTNQSVVLVIPGHKELSPGVQRETLKYTAGLGIRVSLALIIREILKRIFKSEE